MFQFTLKIIHYTTLDTLIHSINDEFLSKLTLRKIITKLSIGVMTIPNCQSNSKIIDDISRDIFCTLD